jgi:hypothetical protein
MRKIEKFADLEFLRQFDLVQVAMREETSGSNAEFVSLGVYYGKMEHGFSAICPVISKRGAPMGRVNYTWNKGRFSASLDLDFDLQHHPDFEKYKTLVHKAVREFTMQGLD